MVGGEERKSESRVNNSHPDIFKFSIETLHEISLFTSL